MKFSPMQRVCILSGIPNMRTDQTYKCVIRRYNLNSAKLMDIEYCVWIPTMKKEFWLSERDLMDEEEWTRASAELIVNYNDINYALDTRNEDWFAELCKRRQKYSRELTSRMF